MVALLLPCPYKSGICLVVVVAREALVVRVRVGAAVVLRTGRHGGGLRLTAHNLRAGGCDKQSKEQEARRPQAIERCSTRLDGRLLAAMGRRLHDAQKAGQETSCWLAMQCRVGCMGSSRVA